MPAYLIAHITIKDPARWQLYVDSVGATLIPYGAEVVFRGQRAEVLIGEHAHSTVAVLKFPDASTIHDWFHSEAYQALTEVRDTAAEVTFISYDT